MELKMYISGKITGLEPEACKLKFAAVEAKLKKMGVSTVINPLNIGIPDTWDWDEAMELCMRVLKEQATSIIQLRDWVESEGAMREYYYARNHGYRIFDEDNTEEIQQLVAHSGQWPDTSRYEFP